MRYGTVVPQVTARERFTDSRVPKVLETTGMLLARPMNTNRQHWEDWKRAQVRARG